MLTRRGDLRKPSSGRMKTNRSKRLFEKAGQPTLTKIGATKLKMERMRGGALKQKLLKAGIANVFDQKTKKHAKAKIKTVIENPANRHFVRRNILTKGTIIDTELGKARITNRPGEEGCVNAVLVE